MACLLLFLWTSLQLASQQRLQRAQEWRDASRWEESAAAYTQAVALNPWHAEAYFQWGDLFWERLQQEQETSLLEQGIGATERAVALSPWNPAYRALLATFYLWGESQQRGTLPLAVAQLERIAQRGQAFQAPYAYRELGQAYLTLGQGDRAEEVYRKLLQAYPQGLQSLQPIYGTLPPEELATLLAEAHLNLGKLLFEAGRGSEAHGHYRAALDLHGEAPTAQVSPQRLAEAHHVLGILQYQNGELAAARTEYQTSLALDPKNPAAWFNLGLVLYQEQNYSEALAPFDRSLSLNPQHAATYYYRALILLKRGDGPGAAASLRDALRWNPEYPQAKALLQQMEPEAPGDVPPAPGSGS